MATWKKVLIWSGAIILVFVILFAIVIAKIYSTPMPHAKLGRYNLTKITEFAGDEELIVEQFEDGECYLLIKDKNILESYSADKGIQPTEKQYYYYLSGEEMPIYFMADDKLAYTAFYTDGLIKAFTKTEGVTRYFYYVLSEEK